MTRRTFALLAGATASASKLFGDVCVYPSRFCLPSPPPARPSLAVGHESTPVAGHVLPAEEKVLPRPLLSEIANDHKSLQRLADQLTCAYQTLSDRSEHSSDCNNDLRGYLAQTWFHYRACADKGVHNNWMFLPWHRGFLYFHEKMIRGIPGLSDFRIPVWDWERIPEIPAVYQSSFLPWAASPLASSKQRLRNTMRGLIDDCSVEAWLLSSTFSQFVGSAPEVGGAAPPKSAAGPHALVHQNINGFLRFPDQAAADPLFFAHHANVDRYWIEWRRSYDRLFEDQKEEQKKFWSQKLTFFDENGELVSVTAEQLKDERTLGYCYEPPKHVSLKVPQFLRGSPEGSGGLSFDLSSLKDNLSAVPGALQELAAPDPHALRTFRKLLETSTKLTNQHIPLYFWAEFEGPVPDLTSNSSSFLLAIAKPPAAPRILGPFAVFSDHPHGGIVGDVCVSLSDLTELASLAPDPSGLTQVQVVYGPADTNNSSILGTPLPLRLKAAELRVPGRKPEFLKLFGLT